MAHSRNDQPNGPYLAICVALLLIIIHRSCLPMSRLSGYWGTREGGLYEIQFDAADRAAFGAKKITISGAGVTVPGTAGPFRRVCTPQGCGLFALDGRTIVWNDSTWSKQGV